MMVKDVLIESSYSCSSSYPFIKNLFKFGLFHKLEQTTTWLVSAYIKCKQFKLLKIGLIKAHLSSPCLISKLSLNIFSKLVKFLNQA